MDYQYSQRAKQSREEAANQIAQRCAIPVAPADIVGMCLVDEIETYRKQYVSDHDLEAQQEMARWAIVMGVVGVIGIPLSFLGLLALWLSLRQTRQAISGDREVGHAQVRAYIAIEPELPDDIRLGHTPSAGVKIKNTGQSPSYFTKYIAILKIAHHPVAAEDENFLFPHPNNIVRAGITVPSHGDFSAEAIALEPLTAEDIGSAMNGGDKRIYLACIVYYTDVFKQPRVTKFCAYLDDSGKLLTDSKGRPVKAYTWIVAPINNEAT